MILNSTLFKNIKSFVDDNRQVIFFILRVAIIYGIWKFMVWFLGEEKIPIDERIWPWLSNGWEIFNDWIRIGILHSSKLLFSILGYDSQIINEYRILVPKYAYVGVGNYCLGIQLWIFFVALISSYPGNWKRKVIISILGVIFINIMNVIRIVLVLFAFYKYPENMDFNHDYVFNFSVYGFTFLIWYFVIKYNWLNPKVKELQ